MSAKIDFFFNFGSIYSYLAIMRLDEEASEAGVEINWRPFNVHKLFVEQTNIPFPKKKAAKVAYMWRDIERRAARFGLDWNGVPPYVARSLGAFGVPTFAVGTEIFWGHDRMEDAFAWALGQRSDA